MASFVHTLLDGASQRNPLNLFGIDISENEPLNTTWVNHTVATAIPAQDAAHSHSTPYNGYSLATASSWAFGSHLDPNSGGTYYADYNAAYGSDLLVYSVFVRRVDDPLIAPSLFTLGLETHTTAVTHGHRFAWDAAANNWAPATNFGGARGFVDPVLYDDGWRRVGTVYQVGWDTGYADVTVAGDVFGVFCYPNSDKECDVWGHMFERRTAVGALSTANLTDWARGVQAEPYLTGTKVRPNGPLVFRCVRGEWSPGRSQLKIGGTSADAGILWMHRVNPAAPWEVAQVEKTDADVNGDGTLTATLTPFPEMRVCVTELANTTTTLGAWFQE